ncbi:ATP-binding protein [Mesorhizobium sp. B3-1-7]|uniref:AlbA family DNA-binding domain-containing protein n=1 Tax=Mesorhizobium sp. B3-1-7 TaxID=2589894 RepID=UPI0011277D79|nr:ATP-binding protein [Mesorhizobium sp. B3-1-7]TPI63321.1 ATP-binding protein [Mesorhizobium sp. B3-1-7]
MDTADLESRLQGGTETQNFDIKAAGQWDAQQLAKDILAMSNVEDGGLILIGVEDKTFTRQGLSAAQLATYDLDIMRDQMAKFADPHVNFSVTFPKDSNGLTFAAIRVEPFQDVPVLCRRNGADVKEATLYYRNRNKRWQSAAISNSFDLGQVIERATALRMHRFQRLGLAVPAQPIKKLDDELGGL